MSTRPSPAAVQAWEMVRLALGGGHLLSTYARVGTRETSDLACVVSVAPVGLSVLYSARPQVRNPHGRVSSTIVSAV